MHFLLIYILMCADLLITLCALNSNLLVYATKFMCKLFSPKKTYYYSLAVHKLHFHLPSFESSNKLTAEQKNFHKSYTQFSQPKFLFESINGNGPYITNADQFIFFHYRISRTTSIQCTRMPGNTDSK